MFQIYYSWPIWGLLGFLAVFFVLDRARPGLVHKIEEAVIGSLLAAITLISFSQVVARYGFSSGWTGALELTRILFAWLILLGAGYALKINAHLGVDAFIRALPPRPFRVAAVFGALACLAYGVILLWSDWLQLFGANAKGGSIDYWFKFYKIGLGLDELSYPVWMQEAFGLKSRVHRWVAYLALPIGMGLFSYRALEAVVAIWRGKRELVIAGHEAEDLVNENRSLVEE